jgi:hypothetical protein
MQTKTQNILPFDAVLQQRQLPYRVGEQGRAISYEKKVVLVNSELAAVTMVMIKFNESI